MRNDRRWYKWHRTSLLLAIATLLLFALVVIPGVSHAPDQRHVSRYVYFGWPYTHRVVYERDPAADFSTADSLEDTLRDQLLRDSVNGSRVLIPANPGDLTSPFGERATFARVRVWSDRSNWAYIRPNSVGRFLWCGLALNAFIALGTSFAVGGLFEVRCRRRNRILQITVFDLLATFVVIGCVLGASQSGRRQQLKDEQLVNEISKDFPEVIDGYVFGTGGRRPSIWMNRLTDNRVFELDRILNDRGFPTMTQVFGRSNPVNGITVRGKQGLGSDAQPFDAPALARRINALGAVETILLSGLNDNELDILNHLDTTRIKTVSVRVSGLEESLNFEALSRFGRLGQLELINADLERPDFVAPKLDQLEQLVVSREYVGEKALTWLAQLPALKVLILQTSYRDQNVEEIQRRLPGVHVTKDYQSPGGFSAF